MILHVSRMRRNVNRNVYNPPGKCKRYSVIAMFYLTLFVYYNTLPDLVPIQVKKALGPRLRVPNSFLCSSLAFDLRQTNFNKDEYLLFMLWHNNTYT